MPFLSHTTDVLGPPQNITVKSLSPTSVVLSWRHPDRELPQIMSETSSYLLLCWDQTGHKFQKEREGTIVILDNLQANTNYFCNLSLAHSEHHETASAGFTTLGIADLLRYNTVPGLLIVYIIIAETLKLNFIGNTPYVEANMVRVNFLMNRPTTKLTCRILGQRQKYDCKYLTNCNLESKDYRDARVFRCNCTLHSHGF